MRRSLRTIVLALLLAAVAPGALHAQKMWVLETEYLRLVYYDKAHEYLVPHLARCFENSLRFHRSLFHYTPSERIVILLHDFGDYGHGGTSTVPWNYLSIGLEPFDYVYETMPANERMNWLMHHELMHVVATDKAAGADNFFRKMFLGKVAPVAEDPVSMFYSFLTSPRWYSARWYHEGIAVFLETWMAGGLGRVLGGYDEMAFRTMVLEGAHFYDIVGLESEGTTIDFQVGQNSYLYGTRFVIYLGRKYGPQKLIEWFSRDAGSRRYFSTQFRRVYGLALDDAWRQWIESERQWQKENLALVRKNPVTPLRDIYLRSLGSVSRSFYNPKSEELYVGVNYPAEGAQIVAINVRTGARRKLCDVQTPALYFVTSLAYDASSDRLFFTTDNTQGWRDLNEVDIRSGRSRRLLNNCRTGDLVVRPADRSIWGVQHHNGYSSLVRIPAPYTAGWKTLLTLPYGKDIFSLDMSPDGKNLSASMIEIDGRQRLIAMETAKIEAGDSTYQVLHEFENNSPENFVFSPDGKYLFGSSYYSGVSNVFRYDLAARKIDAMSNVETGLFRPQQLSDGLLLAYRYTSKGFVPVTLPNRVVEDVGAIQYLGQQVVEQHPGLTRWNAGSPALIDLDKATTYRGDYRPASQLRPASLYPIAEGYKDTYAVGARMNVSDPVGLNVLDLKASYSPHGELKAGERLHLDATYNRWPWKIRASHNGADFYDLFGPTKTGRKGTTAGASYQGLLINERPRTFEYRVSAAGYVGLDRLPDYQNVAAPFDRLLSVQARLDYKHVRRSLGAVDGEKGVQWALVFQNEYVNSRLFPRLHTGFDWGFRTGIPHSSIWLRTSAGQSLGDKSQPFGKYFFGGFGNNWVDHREVRRFREYYAFPGVEINEVGGAHFGKVTGEWTLPPVRFRRWGFPAGYAHWLQPTLFASGLIADTGAQAPRQTMGNVGLQLDLKLILFSNLESTLSAGYALAYGKHRTPSDEFMVSLKILR